MNTPALPLLLHAILLGLTILPCHQALGADKSPAQLGREIKQLSSQLNQQKQASDSLSDEVTAMEKKLGDITRKQHDTEKKIENTLSRLQEANTRKLKLDDELKSQRSALAQQLQAMYTAGEQSHLRLLLRQDNPSDISRTLRYFQFLNTHRTKRIETINDTIGKIQTLTAAMEQDRQELNGLEEELSVQHKEAQATLSTRAASLKKLDSDIRNKQTRLDKLRKDEAELQAMLERMEQKAEAARQEKLRQQVAARQKAELQTKTAKQAQTAPPRTSQPAPAPHTVAVTAGFTPNKPFSSLKGKLPTPVSGKLIHTYGSSRNEKQNWRGIVISAQGGARVQAVAPGRVVFAGWMDGYGHLIIIEHDQNYMSLYGYNRAVYKKEGQTVKAGETIAAVGNSSGQNENALYFEIRRKAVPQNPAQWLSLR